MIPFSIMIDSNALTRAAISSWVRIFTVIAQAAFSGADSGAGTM